MRGEAINFCEQYCICATNCEDMSLNKMEGELVRFEIGSNSIIVYLKDNSLVKIWVELPEDQLCLETVSKIRKDGGVVFLRVDIWDEKQKQVVFLVFPKEHVHATMGGVLGQDTLRIGVNRKIIRSRERITPADAKRIFQLRDPYGNQYCFAFNIKPKEFSLIGDGKTCTVVDYEYYGRQIKSIAPRKNDKPL